MVKNIIKLVVNLLLVIFFMPSYCMKLRPATSVYSRISKQPHGTGIGSRLAPPKKTVHTLSPEDLQPEETPQQIAVLNQQTIEFCNELLAILKNLDDPQNYTRLQ